eukprot:CAMPEP_0171069590 /NCGR_PEP_ID=MMETSP0766_2-20121228/9238_1 /TAXON_ID=439317 /ORGANISM="Gambierdiscus australes, Strain CAWD 149" /LENGTH=63 /DNA_ID=CAMNT_0011525981 /DNA_START=93 /DNA_END=281 /DNA_ORIENTATION=+
MSICCSSLFRSKARSADDVLDEFFLLPAAADPATVDSGGADVAAVDAAAARAAAEVPAAADPP